MVNAWLDRIDSLITDTVTPAVPIGGAVGKPKRSYGPSEMIQGFVRSFGKLNLK